VQPVGEPLLQLRARALGYLDRIDLHDGHASRVVTVPRCPAPTESSLSTHM
jgi:hypothetical protein